ncbi:MAG: DsrE/DsrF/DrsH-like family protein [Actinobacteria bacterium]|nr:DsrE/DsrF/DrsH-like family protein [Actinomycetota bacterium]
MDGADETLSLVLFSGTDDRPMAAAVLAAGAAAMGRKVNVFLQYWALDTFRAERIHENHGVAPEFGLRVEDLDPLVDEGPASLLPRGHRPGDHHLGGCEG